MLRYLTADDRQLIAQATGTKLNADDLDDQGLALAPITGFEIAIDGNTGLCCLRGSPSPPTTCNT